MLGFNVRYEFDDGVFFGHVEEIPGFTAVGRTFEEVEETIGKQIEAAIQQATSDGMPVASEGVPAVAHPDCWGVMRA